MKRPSYDIIKAAGKKLNLSPSTIEGRVYKYGWTWEKALSKPKINGGKASRKANPGYGDVFIIDHRKEQIWEK